MRARILTFLAGILVPALLVGGISIAYAVSDGTGVDVLKNTSYSVPATATVAANAATIDWANGDSQVVNLQGATGTVTITMSNPRTTGMLLRVIQGDHVGTVVFSPVIHTTGGGVVTAITATNDAVDYISFWWDGAAYALIGHTQDLKAIP